MKLAWKGPDLRPASDDPAAQGHYARKQLLSRSRLIAWAHGARFRTALRLARPFAGRKLLDCGCGDGTFLALLARSAWPPKVAIGAEIDGSTVDDCRRRLAGERLTFVLTSDLDEARHREAYDVVFCTEVLEHVVDPDSVLCRLETLLAPEGTLIASVPIETGVPLLVKQAVRRVAGWRGIGDYPGTTSYTIREYLRSLFPGKRQHIPRPVHIGAHGPFHDHKGFNWRRMRAIIAERVRIQRVVTSPVHWLPPDLESQAWFVARRR